MHNVEACNLALSRIGHGAQRRISALDESSEQAEACDRVFLPTLRLMLSEFTWPFARACAALAEISGTAPSGWGYAYALPANALGVRYVETDGFLADWLALDTQANRWEVMAHPTVDGQIVVTDLQDAVCCFIKDITEVQFTSELFANAFAWRMAAELALGLKADPKLAQNAMTMGQNAMDTAVAVHANQRGGSINHDAEVVLARGAGGYEPNPWCRY